MSKLQINPNSCKKPDVPEILLAMYNNKKYSDTLFHVNQVQFHASSHLVSVSCKVLESILEEHFENCGDREITIGQIKHISSFSVLLKYIYGFEVKFAEYDQEVICEVLQLCKGYDLEHFFSCVKTYLSHLDNFQIGAIASLLNTAHDFQLQDLDKKLKSFVLENVESFVKHKTFEDLKYNILLDFIKSEFFCLDEVEILKGVLKWHDGNIIDGSSVDQDLFYEIHSQEIVDSDEEDSINNCKDKESLALDSDDKSKKSDSKVNVNSASDEEDQDNLKTFSKNVLISLLSHVRFKLISSVEFYQFSKTPLYEKYKAFLDGFEYSSPISEARSKKLSINLAHKDFYTKVPGLDEMLPTPVVNLIKNFEFIFYFSCSNRNKFSVFIECLSNVSEAWKCSFICQVQILPLHHSRNDVLYIPENDFKIVEVSSKRNPRVHVGDFVIPRHLQDGYYDVIVEDYQTIDASVTFKSIVFIQKNV